MEPQLKITILDESLQSFETAQARDTVTVTDIECTFWTKIRNRRRANTLSTQQQRGRKTVQRPTCKKEPPASYINPQLIIIYII